MHTDRKIGFAMGILLIGIVAALFFRNEPLLETSVPAVRRERELNDRLRERDVAVYLNDTGESTEQSDDSRDDQPWTLRDILRTNERNRTLPSAVSSSNSASASELDGREPPSLDGFRRSRAVSADDIGEGIQTEPEPVTAAKTHQLPPLFPSAETESVILTTDSATATAAAPASDFQPPRDFDEYTVKYGDTLSGIAQKTLGAPSRYREIYEANRDRMASPDRLDIGRTLRIPRTAGAPATTY